MFMRMLHICRRRCVKTFRRRCVNTCTYEDNSLKIGKLKLHNHQMLEMLTYFCCFRSSLCAAELGLNYHLKLSITLVHPALNRINKVCLNTVICSTFISQGMR